MHLEEALAAPNCSPLASKGTRGRGFVDLLLGPSGVYPPPYLKGPGVAETDAADWQRLYAVFVFFSFYVGLLLPFD